MKIVCALLLCTFLVIPLMARNHSHARARVRDATARIKSHRASRLHQPTQPTPSSTRLKRQENVEPILLHICPVEDEPEALDLQPHIARTNHLLDQAFGQVEEARQTLEARTNEQMREADATLHRTLHTQHAILPGAPSFSFQSRPISQPGYFTPGLNFNINQNQATQSGLGGGFHSGGFTQILPGQSMVPGHSIVPGQSIVPTQSIVVAPQSQSIFRQVEDRNQQLETGSAGVPQFSQTQASGPLRESENPVIFPVERQSNVDSNNRRGHDEFLARHQSSGSEPHQKADDLREADPTFKKKKHKHKEQKYYPTYNQHYQYRVADDFNNDEIDFEVEEVGEANPTLHKLKHKKHEQQYPTYYQKPQQYSSYYPGPPSYHQYRESEFVGAENNFELPSESREATLSHKHVEEVGEANPTIHKLKHKKHEQQYPTYYPKPQQYSSYYPGQSSYHQYRESEFVGAENDFELPSESREATPTHKHKKKKYPNQYREAEEDDMPDSEDQFFQSTVAEPHLFTFPARRHVARSIDHLDSILGSHRQQLDIISEKSKHDEDLTLVADIINRTLTNVEDQRKKINKRSIPLTRLITDPKVRLDVPKTFENLGTATKNSWENEKAPLYHLKHLMGSSRNAILSAMRIPPQNMIIPSDYEIVKSEDGDTRTRSSRDQDDPFSNTFQRVGEIVRESVKSGQETASHISDIAYDAKNVLNSARHSVPRMIIRYSQVPALQDKRHKTPSKAILITPRIFDLANERLEKQRRDSSSNFVKLTHLMDAVGITDPNSKNVDLQKIIFETRKPHQRLAQMYDRFDINDVVQAVNTLEDAKVSVGAKSLRDMLLKMKNEFTNPADISLNKPKSKKKKKPQKTKEMGVFIETLFDGSEEVKDDETVGSELFLSPQLMHPFMGRPSEDELRHFLKDNGDEGPLRNKRPQESKNNENDLDHVLGAINPLMFERIFNESLNVKNDNTNESKRGGDDEGDDAKVGTSMTLNAPMLKPFMGQAQPEQIRDLLETYNGTPGEDYVEIDE